MHIIFSCVFKSQFGFLKNLLAYKFKSNTNQCLKDASFSPLDFSFDIFFSRFKIDNSGIITPLAKDDTTYSFTC